MSSTQMKYMKMEDYLAIVQVLRIVTYLFLHKLGQLCISPKSIDGTRTGVVSSLFKEKKMLQKVHPSLFTIHLTQMKYLQVCYETAEGYNFGLKISEVNFKAKMYNGFGFVEFKWVVSCSHRYFAKNMHCVIQA